MASQAMALPPAHLIYVSNMGSRRCRDFLAAAGQFPQLRITLLTWREILSGQWDQTLLRDAHLLKLDSPGKNAQVEQQLLLAGAEEVDELDPSNAFWRLSRAQVLAEIWEIGRIPPLRQWQLGFRRVLRDIAAACPPQLRLAISPEDVLCLFDKEATTARLLAVGCPTPDSLGIPMDFADLMERAQAAGVWRVFVKSCHSSSASGMAAVEWNGHGMQAFTTMEMPRMVNNRQVQRVQGAAVVELVNALCRLRCTVQPWMPKAGWQGHRVDFRVVTIGGKATHVVPRLSKTPFTTLQLGGRRGDVPQWRAEAGEDAWQRLLATAEHAARAFPQAHCLGVDVLMTPGWRKASVLEVNAFGDLLPGVVDIFGQNHDTYARQLRSLTNSAEINFLS